MANQRDKSKRQIGFYATPEEKAAIEAIAKKRGISVSELLRGIATGSIKLGLIALVSVHCFRSPLNWSVAAVANTGKAIAAFACAHWGL